MTNLARSKTQKRKQRRRSLTLFLLLLFWSSIIAWGLTLFTQPQSLHSQTVVDTSSMGTVDVIPQRYRLGQELYLDNCATCHIGVPPAVLPTETWADLIQDAQHYGVQIKPLIDPQRTLVWQYLRTFSRERSQYEERTPYRIAQSRYFKALHPQIKIPRPLPLASCITCHPRADKYDFRSLSAEWQD
ncbi:diheme cytochrome C [Floridanema evergladense]|uniref:Diheme cytochrome C n=1 Tax=Floridaenema evergladense BLCC-F167 TaxID=3153639 RepID=A0ABV4WXW7_9CYAN